MRFFKTFVPIAIVLASAGSAWAERLAAPTGQVLLTVSGNIENTNGDSGAAFDRTMLEDLDWQQIETFTSFTDGPQQFAGPTLASLLSETGAEGTQLRATAINDYSVQIPMDHVEAHNVILAVDHNGKQMRVRNKGPIWVVYPMSEAEAAKKPFDGEMIWQLNRISVE